MIMIMKIVPQVISTWIMDQPHLGHKQPRPGLQRLFWCPSCLSLGSRVHLTSRHNLNSPYMIRNLLIGMFLKAAPP